MNHKRILVGLSLCLFLISAGVGYFWVDLVAWREASVKESFVRGAVPKRVVEEFRAQFNDVFVATEPHKLPDAPFKTIKGETRRLSEFRGKPTLVNFWASWCTPCVLELPSLEKLVAHYDGKIQVVSIALQENKSLPEIAAFLKKRGIGDFAGNLDEESGIAGKLSITGLPTSFLIGSDGNILYRFDGDAVWDSAESFAFFDVFILQNK